MRILYLLAVIMLITAIVATFFTEQMSFVFFVILIELVLILSATEVLLKRMPRQLVSASDENCVRIDGSRSRRRSQHEQRARDKVRSDLLATFLLIALTGNWLAMYLHSEIIPFPLAVKAAKAFDVDSDVWKRNLRDQHVDEEYVQWSMSKVPTDYEQIESQQQTLWYAWPLIIFLGLAWAIGSAWFLSRAYLKILREFAAGIAFRSQTNLTRDVTRLQSF